MAVFHIRRRMPRRGGNQYYLDRSNRPVFTYCGAPVTEYDDNWRSKAHPWKRRDGTEMVACVECVRVRKASA